MISEPSGIVTNVTHEELKSNTINFLWEEIPCKQRGGIKLVYVIYISFTNLNNASDSWDQNSTASTSKFSLKNVPPFTSITVRIQPENDAGRGQISTSYAVNISEESKCIDDNAQLSSPGGDRRLCQHLILHVYYLDVFCLSLNMIKGSLSCRRMLTISAYWISMRN